MKKGVRENFPKFTGKHLWFASFSKTPFLQTASGFFVQCHQNGILPAVFGKPQMNIQYLETFLFSAG